jgi:hypothetical protein
MASSGPGGTFASPGDLASAVFRHCLGTCQIVLRRIVGTLATKVPITEAKARLEKLGADKGA